MGELAELVHLSADLLGRFPGELSGGQRQRVSLMRALMLDPELLLLDEPLGALDPMIRSGLQEDLREVFRTLGKTVVLVTHDLAEAAFFADHLVLLRKGRHRAARGRARPLGEPRGALRHRVRPRPAHRGGGAVIALLALLPLAAAPQELQVGSKKFTESVVLGEMLSQLLVDAGFEARHRSDLGGTRVLWSALVAGEIDAYVEYSGTLREEIFAGRDLSAVGGPGARPGRGRRAQLGADRLRQHLRPGHAT